MARPTRMLGVIVRRRWQIANCLPYRQPLIFCLGRCWKDEVRILEALQLADDEESLSELGHPEVNRVQERPLAEVAEGGGAFEECFEIGAASRTIQPIHVLHQKKYRSSTVDQSNELKEKIIARIVSWISSLNRKTLARGPPGESGQFPFAKGGLIQQLLRLQFTNVSFEDVGGKVATVSSDDVWVIVERKPNVETSTQQAKREPAAPSESIES